MIHYINISFLPSKSSNKGLKMDVRPDYNCTSIRDAKEESLETGRYASYTITGGNGCYVTSELGIDLYWLFHVSIWPHINYSLIHFHFRPMFLHCGYFVSKGVNTKLRPSYARKELVHMMRCQTTQEIKTVTVVPNGLTRRWSEKPGGGTLQCEHNNIFTSLFHKSMTFMMSFSKTVVANKPF